MAPHDSVARGQFCWVVAYGVIVRVAVFEPDPTVVVIFEVVLAVTAFVVIANVPVAEPAAIEKEAATVADVEDDFRVTVMALTGVAFSVTVPVEEAPPFTDVGESVNVEIANGLTVSVAL